MGASDDFTDRLLGVDQPTRAQKRAHASKQKKKLNIWQPMETCPENMPVIGIRIWPDNDDTGVICGVKYDLNSKAIIDRNRGRWMECTHWAYPPKE